MNSRKLGVCVGFLALSLSWAGCDRKEAAPADAGQASPAGQSAPKAEANFITGRVTMEDGKPLAGDIKDISIAIYGVSDAAEKVSYGPAVNPDGTYRQKVAGGQYVFSRSQIKVRAGGNVFDLPLEPVGSAWNKNRDATTGITQDFVWKVKGPTPYGQDSGLDPGNATHWYGMSVGLRADGYREDIKKSPTPIPAGTLLTFTAKPVSKGIDGSDLQPVNIERNYDPNSYKALDLNDLVPASYEISGTAKLPDGKVVPLLLQGRGDYPKYKPVIQVPLDKDNIIGGFFKPSCTFVID